MGKKWWGIPWNIAATWFEQVTSGMIYDFLMCTLRASNCTILLQISSIIPVLTLCVRSELRWGLFDYRAHGNSKLTLVLYRNSLLVLQVQVINIEAKHMYNPAKARNDNPVDLVAATWFEQVTSRLYPIWSYEPSRNSPRASNCAMPLHNSLTAIVRDLWSDPLLEEWRLGLIHYRVHGNSRPGTVSDKYRNSLLVLQVD